MRQGLGVRKSAPYGVASENNHAVRAAQSQSSLPSTLESDRGGWKGPGSSGGSASGDHNDRSRSETIRSGFVLRATSTPSGRSRSAYRSTSPGGDKKSSFRKFMRKLRKPKSTGDLTSVGAHTIAGTSSSAGSGRFMLRASRAGGSLRSNVSGGSQFTANSVLEPQNRLGETPPAFDGLDEPLGPNVTETYIGQWNEDRRSGYGVAERSDGLRYEGEWFNNKKDGFGMSFHPDGSLEEGRYKENLLIQPLVKRNKLYLLRHSKLRDSVEEAVKKAKDASKEAQEKAVEIAHQRLVQSEFVNLHKIVIQFDLLVMEIFIQPQSPPLHLVQYKSKSFSLQYHNSALFIDLLLSVVGRNILGWRLFQLGLFFKIKNEAVYGKGKFRRQGSGAAGCSLSPKVLLIAKHCLRLTESLMSFPRFLFRLAR